MSSINWSDNRMLDPSTPRRTYQPSSGIITTQSTVTTPPVVTAPPAVLSMQEETMQGPPPSTEPGYIPNYLKRNIGKNVLAEFSIGTNFFVDRTGIIKEVGVNYFVLHDSRFNTDVMCDLYSVKFVTSLPG